MGVLYYYRMQLTSPAFIDNQHIPDQYTCHGEDISPPLRIEDVPEKTVSLALIVDDPDAPKGDWVHWVMWNIPAGTREIPEDGVPPGATEGSTDFGTIGYGGPCPPSGIHRYHFKLYALDTMVSLDSTATKKDLLEAISGHSIDETLLIGLYGRLTNAT